VCRGLLVPDQHVPQPRVFRQGVIERHDRPAGVAEQHVDAVIEQSSAEDLRSGQ
jgi:hypothetical protein